MVATTEHDTPVHGVSRRRRGALRTWIAGFLTQLRAGRQRALDRRLIEELPEYLLRDMGISRAQVGMPAEAADILRAVEGWR